MAKIEDIAPAFGGTYNGIAIVTVKKGSPTLRIAFTNDPAYPDGLLIEIGGESSEHPFVSKQD